MQPTERFYEADAYRTAASSVITAARTLEGGGGLVALAGTVRTPQGWRPPAGRRSAQTRVSSLVPKSPDGRTRRTAIITT